MIRKVSSLLEKGVKFVTPEGDGVRDIFSSESKNSKRDFSKNTRLFHDIFIQNIQKPKYHQVVLDSN